MMRSCARYTDGLYCVRPSVTTRRITIMTTVSAADDLRYLVDLCQEHADEYDRDRLIY